MKTVLLSAIMCLTGHTALAAETSELEQLRQLKLTLWPQAYRTQDTALLEQILHPQFQLIDANGKTTSKADELEYIKSNAWQVVNFSYRIDRLEVFSGHTAVISGRGETDTYSYHSSNVLIKKDGRWQAIASHVSGFKAKKDQQQVSDAQ